MEAIASQDDIEKLKQLREVPTDITSIEQMLKMGSEGKTAFDAVGIFMGADDPEIAGMLQRTNFQSPDEVFTVAETLYLSKYGFLRAWVKGGPPSNGEWEMPEIKQLILWMIQGRPSINSASAERAKEAIQGLKVKLNTQQNPLSGF